MIKRNLENVQMFTYLCRPQLQGTDAALQASLVSLSMWPTPELSRTTNFQTGFASCDVPQPLKSECSRLCTFGPGVAHLVSGVWWLCAFRPQAGPRSAAEENILLYYDFTTSTTTAMLAQLVFIQTVHFIISSSILQTHFLSIFFQNDWCFIAFLTLNFFEQNILASYKISDLRINLRRHLISCQIMAREIPQVWNLNSTTTDAFYLSLSVSVSDNRMDEWVAMVTTTARISHPGEQSINKSDILTLFDIFSRTCSTSPQVASADSVSESSSEE